MILEYRKHDKVPIMGNTVDLVVSYFNLIFIQTVWKKISYLTAH